MTRTLSEIWQQLQQAFSVQASLNTTTDTGKAILAATQSIHEQNVSLEVIKPVLENSSSLLDVLSLPLAEIVGKELSYVSLGVNLLKLYADITQQCPALEECVLIVSQVAYLQSIRDILALYPFINWDTNLDNLEEFKTKLHIINDIELDEETAKNTISCFHESELAAAFNQILSARLIAPNITKFLVNLLTKRVAFNTHRYIINTWIDADDIIQDLIANSCVEWQQEQQIIIGIEEYLKEHIATQPLAKVFDQSYSWKDIYIPLTVEPFGQKVNPLDIETWAKGVILNQQKLEQVMLIESQPGRGKSVFCQIFADWVWQHLHPLWTPILIRLKDIHTVYSAFSLEKTLQAELKVSCHQTNETNENLLHNKNTRFIFILDGFDDLHIDLEEFIQQVAAFQKKCKNQAEMGHRVLITGRTNTLKYITNLPHNLERVEILEMDRKIQEKWLKKWALLPENQVQKIDLDDFLSSKKCPSTIKKLAVEPLYLHLLALMYRDEKLAFNKLEQANKRTAKVVIWQEFVNWLIAKQKLTLDDSEVNNQEYQNYQSYLQNLLTETAVAVVQSGGVFGSVSMIKSRLQEPQTDIPATLNQFYFIPAQKQEDKIECYHKTFSEFLFAEKLTKSLQYWSRFNLDDQEQIQEMNWQIYDLLGFGKINSEIVEYVIGLLTQVSDLYWINLFKVLENFYNNWCQGKFIDTPEATLAQTKLRELQQYSENDRIENLGQRQIDIYAGLNVMILLLEIQRYAQEHDVLKEYIIFYPSGETQGDNLTSDLQRLINYCNCLRGDSFKSIVGQFFSATHLRATYLFQTDLSCTDLSQADLSRAELSRSYLLQTNLSHAYLIGAKLIQADLRGANLSGANLIRTDLRGADLSNANLQDADLSRVDLSGANLRGANLSGAYLIGANFGDELFGYIRWDKNTNWEDVDGLEAAKNLPPTLKQHLKMG
ncbi:pentapeptide repeat-containing protein [Sphaerospermopsis sp. LEGE 00249]|uniref:NACHT domain-containing protein n=1 Tax=Sphaerospermopsis sp. LEGE 00249 TaxID=1380707 RepID=UPI00164EB2F9|nr:pentapeptide repeat-containing protein [Sphaerospermopsis sp. LEGE 00249]MBC5798161.1 pentapeptide repeat-containing protein [Sphaerospermopsis sp. LEGE 00249]